MRNNLAVTFAVVISLLAGAAQARSYEFRVSCSHTNKVVQWGIGSIDPGKEYLRVNTGTMNPGCSISDYNPATDAGLPVERHSDAGGVLKGLTLPAVIGGALGGLFGGISF